VHSYHTAKSLQMMKQYRIGRVQLPWKNLEPPIQSASYRERFAPKKPSPVVTQGHKKRRSIDATALGLLKPLRTSIHSPTDGAFILPRSTLTRRASAPLLSPDAKRQQNEKDLAVEEKVRMQFATSMEQKEIAQGKLEWPALDQTTQTSIKDEYRILHQQIKDKGLYQCNYSAYGRESIRYALLFSTFLFLLNKEWYLTSAVALGLFWQQIMFTAHDAGHRGITGHFIPDTLIGAFIADFCCGLSIGWWKSSHNVHHLITNMPEHDPDIQNIPLFSTSPTYMKSIFSTYYNFQYVWDKACDVMVPYQKYTYYPVMAVARFNLYILSWLHLLSPRATQLGSAWWTRYVELVFMACYWAIFGYALVWCTLPTWPIRIGFVLVSHMITMILHVQITLSHWGMPTSDFGPAESFPQRQLRTTMDVDCPAWMDFVHGGLQFQAVHHLFPRVPRHNLRECQSLVRQFCKKTDLKYQCYGFAEGNGIVLGRLDEVGKMVGMMIECQEHMAATGESGLH
jgi:delta8-fatty-acid desaturase